MKKVCLVCYGEESKFFPAAVDLWRERQNLADWELITCRLGGEDQTEDFLFDGQNLVVRMPTNLRQQISSDSNRFELTGKWTATEMAAQNYRKFMYARFLLAYLADHSFILMCASATSVVNFDNLNYIIDCFDVRPFVASRFGRAIRDDKELLFPSGAGFILDKKAVEMLALSTEPLGDADDVHTGRVLNDCHKYFIQRYDIIHPSMSFNNVDFEIFERRIRNSFLSGFIQIRVKLVDNRNAPENLFYEQLRILSSAHLIADDCHAPRYKCESLIKSPW